MSLAHQRQFLEKLQQKFLQTGLESKLEEPNNEADFYTLITRFGSIGLGNYVLDFNLSFIPLPSQSQFCLIQFFGEILTNVESDVEYELLFLMSEINAKIPLGVLGYLPSKKISYFKHDYIMEESFEEKLGLYLSLVEQQYSILLGILNNFVDGIFQVANRQSTAKKVLQLSEFSSIFQ